MNKIIFQIGLLAFCVSAVVFGSQHLSLLEIISRSFIVFVAVILAAAVILAVSASFADKGDPGGQARGGSGRNPQSTSQSTRQYS